MVSLTNIVSIVKLEKFSPYKYYIVCTFAIHIVKTMGKKSLKERAYMVEPIGKCSYPMPTDSMTRDEALALLDSIPIRYIMDCKKVKNALERRDAKVKAVSEGVVYGKQSLAFGYLVSMVLKYLWDVRSKVEGLRGLTDRHFEILLNAWVVCSLNDGVFKRSQLLKLKKTDKKYFAQLFRELLYFGHFVELSALEVNNYTNKIVSPHAFAHRFYRLSRETSNALDEFNVLFAKIYKDATTNFWQNDLEKL